MPTENGAFRYYVAPYETSAKRMSEALAALEQEGEWSFVRVLSPWEADLVWLNTKSAMVRQACEAAMVYNHSVGARAVLEDKSRMARLQEAMGCDTLESRAFDTVEALMAWFALSKPEGAWVIKDATANSGYGLWFCNSWSTVLGTTIQTKDRIVAQRYLDTPLLQEGKKTQLRCYCVFRPDGCWLYEFAMLQVCALPYEGSNFNNVQAYVTNVAANVDSPDFVPERPIQLEGQTRAGVVIVARELARAASPVLRFAQVGHFEMCGLDIVFDDSRKPWLIECNCPPNNYGSSLCGEVEKFHHNLAVDVVRLALAGKNAQFQTWSHVSSVRSPVSAHPRLAHAAVWYRFERVSRDARRECYGSALSLPCSTSKQLADAARREFPYFLDDAKPIFLENAGGSQVPRPVRDAVCKALDYRWRERDSKLWRRQARDCLKAYFNAPHVFLGANASSLLNSLSSMLTNRSPAVVCLCSHQANLRPWLGAKQAVRIAEVPMLVNDQTRVVALPHASNVTGAVFDIAAVASEVKKVAPNCRVIVDGVAYAPHRPLDLDLLFQAGVDFYVVSLHKLFGPHLAAMACARLDHLEPVRPGRLRSAENFELGTVSAEACAGAVALIDLYLRKWEDPAAFRLAEAAPFARLLLFLQHAPNVRCIRHPDDDSALLSHDRLPIVSFVHRHISASDIVEATSAANIAIRAGDFLAPAFLEFLGLDAVVRVSLAHYNTLADVNALIGVMSEIPDWSKE